MQKKIIQEVYNDLINHLTDKQFLKNIRLSKKAMLELIRQENWIENIKYIIEKEKISCSDVLTVCGSTLSRLAAEPKAGWLHDIYDHILHQMFPESSDRKTSPSGEGGRLLYLEVLKTFLCYERRNKDFDSALHMQFLTEEETKKTESADEYLRLMSLFRENYMYEFMRIGMEQSLNSFDVAKKNEKDFMKEGRFKSTLAMIRNVLTLVIGIIFLIWALQLFQWTIVMESKTPVWRIPITVSQSSLLFGLTVATSLHPRWLS